MREIIREVRRKIITHREVYLRNEEAVKQHLILPLLEELGWKIDDPSEVRPEEKTGEGRADYALVKGGRVVAFLEAKNLSVNISKAVPQLAKYCFDMGVEVGVVTNGARWLVVNAFEPGREVMKRVVGSIDVLSEPIERLSLKFIGLSKDIVENAVKFYRNLRLLENSAKDLVKLGASEVKLAEYVLSLPLRGHVVGVEDVGPSDRILGVYIFDGGWRFIPVEGRELRDALVAVLRYFIDKSSKEDKKAIEVAIKRIKVSGVKYEKVVSLLRGIEEEKGVKIKLVL
ncbi:type I restriction endonuclease [Pyrococcus kukulkanii]|uniref:Type I restriction enzyme HsdR N-terminal domain-containing protein n=1 Tax=Pyrococcus kukulkanii TaxID=1609559 RepID=A0ABV4T6X2_9EURY